jgi:YebC/PmpR family DNA-binding regulatory protein
MAGHSKWANTKHRKQRQDAKRGKEFGKAIRLIESAAKESGTSDPEMSPSLATAVQKAKDISVPKDAIERACKRGAGELDEDVSYETAQYEGYAPGGVAVLVDILTDNRNRTASDVRGAFTKTGGNLAEPGAVAFMFSRRGQVVLERGSEAGGDGDGVTEDDVMLAGLESGLEDVEVDEDTVTAWCDPSDVTDLRKALEEAGLKVTSSGTTMVPATYVPVEDPGDAKKILRLLDYLDDSDDVQEVYANFDIPDDVLDQATADA